MMTSCARRFQQSCDASANFIANGGLKLPDGWSQVDEKAWALLSEINRRGLCTIDSQSGECYTRNGHDTKERAYVSGFMLRDQALAFAEAINSTTSFVAFEVIRVKSEHAPCPHRSASVRRVPRP